MPLDPAGSTLLRLLGGLSQEGEWIDEFVQFPDFLFRVAERVALFAGKVPGEILGI